MQQAVRHYSRAPITEAILDLKVILPDKFPIEKFLLEFMTAFPQVNHRENRGVDKLMAVVMQPTQQNHDVLGTDEGLVRGMGISANEILEHRRRLTQTYYQSSEVLLNYPSDSFLFVDPGIFERFVRRSLGDTFNDLKRLRTWDVGWNGYGAPKPEHTAIEHARSWITSLFQTVANLGWIKPNVTGGPEGSVVFEWWYGKRKLTVYVEEQSIEYVQVWGTDVDAKITDGDIESMSDSRELWMWLIGLECRRALRIKPDILI